jgi:hypothetical protein
MLNERFDIINTESSTSMLSPAAHNPLAPVDAARLHPQILKVTIQLHSKQGRRKFSAYCP